MSMQQKNVGYLAPFEINKERSDLMNNFGFKILRNIVSSDPLNNFQKHLLTSIFWFGYAMNIYLDLENLNRCQWDKKGYENIEYFNINQKFIFLFISLESLLKKEGERRYTSKVIERLNKLLINDDQEYQRLINKIGRFFEMRGEVIHQGVDYITRDDVLKMTFFVQTVFRQ